MTDRKPKKKVSAATAAKISKALRGRVFSDEHRQRISEALRGNRLAAGHRVTRKQIANLNKNRRGRKINPESLKNLRQFNAKKGKPDADPE